MSAGGNHGGHGGGSLHLGTILVGVLTMMWAKGVHSALHHRKVVRRNRPHPIERLTTQQAIRAVDVGRIVGIIAMVIFFLYAYHTMCQIGG